MNEPQTSGGRADFQQAVTCRSCGAQSLTPVLSLGSTPLANSLLTAEQLKQPEPVFPLDLVFCRECTLVQITETVPPETLFSNYFYFSSFSDTMLEHVRHLAERLIESQGLGGSHLVLEVASNDGYLLQNYKRAGVPVLGIEPASNVAQDARDKRGVPTLCEFFGEPLARRLREEGTRADIVHGNNVLAHVADLNGFVRGLALVLQDTGLVVIEVPYVKDMIDGCEFDTIYHEHLCYFSLTALSHLFQRNGLAIVDVERLKIHGGSLRVFARREGAAAAESVSRLLAEEEEWRVGSAAFYETFGEKVKRLRRDLLGALAELKAEGKSVAAYGASAKGSTLLNYLGIGRETLDFVVDRSTIKQGYYTPGTHLPIYDPEKLLDASPDYVLLLTWNFEEEILEQQAEFRQRGGRFIVPIPEVRVI